MATSAMVHVRVNKVIKEQAAAALETMGLSVSDALRIFLARVAAEKALPFSSQVPNAVTLAAMAEAEGIVGTRAARYR